MAPDNPFFLMLVALLLLSIRQANAKPEDPVTSPPSGFWVYYLENGTEDGDVFDPSDLEAATALAAESAGRYEELSKDNTGSADDKNEDK